MNFAELRFWGWLLLGFSLVLPLRWLVFRTKPGILSRYDRVALLSLGLFLLLCVSWLTFLIWCAVAVGSYLGLQWILSHDPHSTRKYLWVLIPVQLAPLLYYKYANFALNEVMGFQVDSVRSLLIPVGLSFYTFQKVAFVLDTLAFRERIPAFLDYLNFAGFFPQIVAGPIERKKDLLPQMERFQFRWNRDWLNEGASWITVGLFFKCCLADNQAKWLPQFVGSASNAYMIWFSNLLFGLRIYYDFAGYSLVAYGLARCLGIQLTLNFVSPYCSTSIQEFWRRWHVTLSNWFRDYVYIPLGGGRVSWWAWNIATVFVVSGLWHGAGWNFVLWGALHGGFLILQRRLGSWKVPASLGWLGTMFAALLAWLCFYETRTDALWNKLIASFSLKAYHSAEWQQFAGMLKGGDAIVLGSLLLLSAVTLTLEWLSVRWKNEPYSLLRQPWVLILLVILTVLLAPGRNNAFIYFAF